MATEVRLDLVANDKASKDIKSVSNSTKEATTQTTLLGGAMNMVRGAMTKVKATSKLLFGSIKAGLISTGIGAFVVVIGSLVAYFTQTKKGAELLEQAFAGIGAAISVLTDRISKIGGAILKVFSGDFKGAAEDVKGALSGIGDEIVAEAKAAARLKGELQNLKDAARGFNIEKAKTNQEIAKALLLAEDESESNEKRLEALKEALALEEETTKKQLELQRRKVAAIEEEVALGESLEEDLDRLNEEKVRLIELETASIKMKKKVVTQVNDFEKQIASEELARIKERTDAEAEATKIKEEAAAKQTEIDNKETERLATQEETRQTNIVSIVDKFKLEKEETELQAIETEMEKQLAELERLQASEQAKADVIAFFNNEIANQKEIDSNQEITNEKLVQSTKLKLAASAFGSLSQLFKEGSKASKAAALAEIGINSALGFIQGLDIAQKGAKGTGPLAPYSFPLFYGSQIAAVLGAVGKAKSVLGAGGGGGGAPSVSSVPSIGGNLAASIPAATGLGDVVNSVNAQGQAPVEAFVISQTVTDSQEAQSYINNQRTL
tara:strand:- start:604 stop:2265 length:1662 start_codon:yes stop_codon:yes gene_type:complete